MKEYMAKLLDLEKAEEEEKKKESKVDEKKRIDEDTKWLEQFINELLKKTGMERLKDILIFSPTEAGYRAWLDKGYKGTFEEFMTLYNIAVKIYGEWKSFTTE